MSITRYKKKRNFKTTPEPKADSAKVDQSRLPYFVIQKHDASHMHFDFRIEVDGVLVSWAVPKGISLDPKERSLAIKVEDHPLDYRTFEGVIPEGNYGAGSVMIWDQGTYHTPNTRDSLEINKELKRKLKTGHIKIILDGVKLNGQFALVKIKDKNGAKDTWLIIKDKDEFASAKIDHIDQSVVSGRTLTEIGGGHVGSVIPVLSDASRKLIAQITPTVMPEITPMLAKTSVDIFDDEHWIYEVKWDGYRALAFIKDHEVNLQSRNGISFNDQFEHIVTDLTKYKDMILDGEIVVLDADGRSDFQALHEFDPKNSSNLRYVVFDIVYLDGHDLRNLSLADRKAILHDVIATHDHLLLSDFVEQTGKSFLKLAQKHDLEGIIGKDSRSHYHAGVRSDDWLKFKLDKTDEVIVCGYKYSSAKKSLSLVTARYHGRHLIYTGNVGTGFGKHNLENLVDELVSLESDTSPLHETDLPGVTWLKPDLVITIKYSQITKDNKYRHPVFVGLRSDKDPRDVKIQHEPKTSKFTITHPNRIYWPQKNISKQNLVEYYEQVAFFMLPYLKDRPQNLNRFPDGINGEGFYQKNMDFDIPDFVDTIDIYSDSARREIKYLICQNLDTLKFMANLGSLEINPWNSRVESLDFPDYLLFDLDPQESDFKNVIKVANEIHKLLDELSIDSYVKTSGKSGLHIYIPLGAMYNFEQVKLLSKLLSTIVHKRLPKITSLVRSPEARKGKVYLDYIQNHRGQTTVGVYSPRPTPAAAVSTPLHWSEVNAKLNPAHFSMKNVLARLEREGDLWQGLLTGNMDMIKVLSALDRIS